MPSEIQKGNTKQHAHNKHYISRMKESHDPVEEKRPVWKAIILSTCTQKR